MFGPTMQILVAMIALFYQHGFYARVVSINNVLLHSTRKKNGAIQDNQRRCFLSFERVAAGPETLGSLSKSLRLALIRLPEVNFPKNVALRMCVGCIQP